LAWAFGGVILGALARKKGDREPFLSHKIGKGSRSLSISFHFSSAWARRGARKRLLATTIAKVVHFIQGQPTNVVG
jgi:hypothetical protein